MAYNQNYDSDYSIRLDMLAALGGDATLHYDSVYDIDLAILAIIQGGIGGAIDDNNVSTGTTYSSAKIIDLIAGAGFSIEVVLTLPATGELRTLYFVPSASPATQNYYDEYLYTGTAWEQIGSTAVDMSAYYTKTEVDNLIDNCAQVIEITQAEYDALSSAEKNNGKIYSITDATVIDMSNYYTKTQADAEFNPYNTTTAYSGYNFPNWNARGQITGRYAQAYLTGLSINGTSRSVYGSSSTTLPSIYAPTTAGTAGYYLVSNGSGAPVWQALEVASDYVIADADASAGTYSTAMGDFYTKTISENVVQGVLIEIAEDHTTTEYSVSDTACAEDVAAGTYFAVPLGSTVDIRTTSQSNAAETYDTTTINADGTITDDAGANMVAVVSNVTIDGYTVFECYEYLGYGTEYPSWTNGDIYLVSSTSETTTSYSYYLPSSSRIYEGNVELWLMTTEDGVAWENIHYLLTGNSVTRDVSTGTFGVVTQSELNSINTALETIING